MDKTPDDVPRGPARGCVIAFVIEAVALVIILAACALLARWC